MRIIFRLNMPSDAPRIVYDARGLAKIADAERIEKPFEGVPIFKLDKKGLIFGLGAVIYGIKAPGVRNWVCLLPLDPACINLNVVLVLIVQ